MLIGIKDFSKLFSISVIVCCAVFVCTLFLNYQIDLVSLESMITTEAGIQIYNAQVSMGKVTVLVTGCCLLLTSIILLLFYIKNFIDTHGKELGLLKAIGYSNIKIAKHFWVFGLSVLIGSSLGFIIAFLYLPTFYKLQNSDNLLPHFEVQFHPFLTFSLICIPTIFFSIISVIYANYKLKKPVLNLLYERQESKIKTNKKDKKDKTFLKSLTEVTLKSKKMLAFFVIFSAFCFSAMVQMSLSMKKISSESFSWMILMIGLILAFTTLFLSLSSVVKGNAKTITMMKAFGYSDRACNNAIFGAYRLVGYIGFFIGTLYQYILLKLVMTFVFANMENIPEYNFDFGYFIITLVLFVITYELIMYIYFLRIKKLSIKKIMVD